IKIIIRFDPNRVIDNRSYRSERIEALRAETYPADGKPTTRQRAKGEGAGEIQNLRKDLRSRLSELQNRLSRDKDVENEIETLKKDLDDLDKIVEIRRIYRFLSEPEPGDSTGELEQADLSLIISLKLPDSTVLNVAKFGDFE